MPQAVWAWLADAVVLLHLAFVAFATLGGFLAWRWRAVLIAHVPALVWAVWIAATGNICPLTPLENRLRILGGDDGYESGFIEHYLLPLLYPVGITRETQGLLGIALIAVNIAAYLGLMYRMRRR